MFGNLAKTLFGSENDRVLKRLAPRVAAINALLQHSAHQV